MKPQNYLPEVALDYLSLLRKTYNVYRKVCSHEEFISTIGKEKILDVSLLPQYLILDSLDSLPSGFENRVYHFKDETHGGGVMDVVFKDNALANIRAQLFIKGIFARRKAKAYLRDFLLPAFKSIFGEPYDSNPDNYYFKSLGIIGTACYVPKTSSVSFYLIDEKYA